MLEPFEVRCAPGAAFAMRSVAAPLNVVGVVVDVPVADVDHVEHSTIRLLAATPDRLLEEEAERAGGEFLAGEVPAAARAQVLVEAAPAEHHRPDGGVGQEQPAVPVEEEVVLEALRQKDVARPHGLSGTVCGHDGLQNLAPSAPIFNGPLPREPAGGTTKR